jgi:hypothetical protein
MKSLDYAGTAFSLWRQIGQRFRDRLTVTTWCIECGAIHHSQWRQRPAVLDDAGTMFHQDCSVDMRNLRRTFGGPGHD